MSKYLSQTIAQKIDMDLMNPSVGGFSIDQLMELAGLSVAQSIQKVYSLHKYPRILVCTGPGNNGGDALVAARHLFHFGYKPSIYYPKPSSKPLFLGLAQQLNQLNVPFLQGTVEQHLKDHDLILDGIFGFSFKGEIRAPFDQVIQDLKKASSKPIISIDIPSGWDVESGNVAGHGLEPEMLISLTYPKLCASSFTGKYHFLGGRFIPPSMAKEYGIEIPEYPNGDQFVQLS